MFKCTSLIIRKKAYIFKNTNSLHSTLNANCNVLSKQKLNQTCLFEENVIYLSKLYKVKKKKKRSDNFGHKDYLENYLLFLKHRPR